MPRGDIRVPISPPLLGVRSDLPKHLVPEGYLVDGQNVLPRNGVIVVRPGMARLTSTAPSANRVMGGIDYRDNTQTQRTVIGTVSTLHSFDGSAWSADIAGSALTGGNSDQVRFSVFPFGATTRLVAVNDVDSPRVWTGSGNFSTLGGSPPIAKSVTTAFQRMILGNVTVSGTRRGSSLWISDFQNPANWPAINQVDLPDTGDVIVEVQVLNTQSFAIYKENSQWIGIGAGNVFPFIFELRGLQPGPVSPASVVRAESLHFYLGNDGNIYQFDGNAVTAIGTHIRSLIYNDMDWSNKARTHGFYDAINKELWWFWPSARASGEVWSGIVYRMPYLDIPAAFSPLMLFGVGPTTSFPWFDSNSSSWNGLSSYTWDGASLISTYPTWDSFPRSNTLGALVGDSSGAMFRVGQQGGDDGSAIDAIWEMPLRAVVGDGFIAQLDVIESFFQNTTSAITASVTAITSNTLGDSGTQETAQTIALDSSGTKLRATFENTTGRFIGVRYRINAVTALTEYRGGVVYCYKRNEGT